MNKTSATKLMERHSHYGYFAVGQMEAYMHCPICRRSVQGYIPKYAKTYAGGETYKTAMVTHLMEEH